MLKPDPFSTHRQQYLFDMADREPSLAGGDGKVSDRKLRGGFYTPPSMVNLVLRRAMDLSGELPTRLRILEPTAGNGALLRGIAQSPLRERVEKVTAVEIAESEAAQCLLTAAALGVPSDVACQDFLLWQARNKERFDMAVGNPPFVRSHFTPEGTKGRARALLASLGLPFKRVSNLWIAVFLGALSTLREGGVFAFVLPADCLTGDSARSARDWVTTNCDHLRLDLLPPGGFPGVLQEVLVVSGKRRLSDGKPGTITIRDHAENGRGWNHQLQSGVSTWTRYLLPPRYVAALTEAQELDGVNSLGMVAKFDATLITGANDFFMVNEETIAAFDLRKWAVPAVRNFRHVKGLVFSPEDHAALRKTGRACALLDFSANQPDPLDHAGARRYLLSGEKGGLHEKYKTRNRRPWYRIAGIQPGMLMLPNRSHMYHRVVVNRAGATTNSGIYRGRVMGGPISDEDMAAVFHNSLTLLTAELEGRSLGGGALDLLPAEVGRLSLPTCPGFWEHLNKLDGLARNSENGTGGLVGETNLLLVNKNIGLTGDLMGCLENARLHMQERRTGRRPPGGEPAPA